VPQGSTSSPVLQGGRGFSFGLCQVNGAPTRRGDRPLAGRVGQDALGRVCVTTIHPSQNARFESAKLQLWLANLTVPNVSAYPPGRVYRAVSSNQNR
jgi:hypothetical protein